MFKIIVQDRFEEIIKSQKNGFDSRLELQEKKINLGTSNSEAYFYYLKFKNGQPSIDEFVEYIYFRIIDFCVPLDERNKLQKKYEETKDTRYIIEQTEKARSLFIKAEKQMKRSGEPGELMLFIFLVSVLNAPQVASKMYLKTSLNMPVHGSDGVHMSHDGSKLILYWGESKLYKNLTTSLDDIVKSIASFNTLNNGITPKDRDIDIIKDYISVGDPLLKEELLKYFDPYEENSNNMQEVFACFSGFESSLLKKNQNKNELGKELNDSFIINYSQRINEISKIINDKIQSDNVKNLKFVFFLVPFESVEEMRIKFYRKLGVEC